MKFRFFSFILSAYLFILAPLHAYALTKDGIEFEDSTSDNLGHNLVINGAGTRKATLFRIKVYTAGLYLKKKSNNPEEILNSDTEKELVLVFHRDVSKEDIQDAWNGSFKDNNPDWQKYQEDFNLLLERCEDIVEGQKLVITIDQTGILVQPPKGVAFQSRDKDFARALLNIWLGPKPPNESLKEGLLGIE